MKPHLLDNEGLQQALILGSSTGFLHADVVLSSVTWLLTMARMSHLSKQDGSAVRQVERQTSLTIKVCSSSSYSGSSTSFLSAAVVCSSVTWSLSAGASTTYQQIFLSTGAHLAWSSWMLGICKATGSVIRIRQFIVRSRVQPHHLGRGPRAPAPHTSKSSPGLALIWPGPLGCWDAAWQDTNGIYWSDSSSLLGLVLEEDQLLCHRLTQDACTVTGVRRLQMQCRSAAAGSITPLLLYTASTSLVDYEQECFVNPSSRYSNEEYP